MYKIILPNFEGPFDLLLYFIKRDELNIYDIPIARLANEFLNYVRLMQYFDLELAGEFLVMAANLMYIKTQLLLPREAEDGEPIPEDPRTQLVERLLEYKKYKEGARNLAFAAEEQRFTYYRNLFDAERQAVSETETYRNTSVIDLLSAFAKMMKRLEKAPTIEHIVSLEPVSTEEKKEFILEKLASKKRISFFELTDGLPKSHLVATFLAILELMKQRFIYIFQDAGFEDITIAAAPQESIAS
ncbi:MAG: segregation and condensation protein A [Chloroflexota bacterium]